MKLASTQPGSVECLICFPGLAVERMPAVATNMDRRGAVVHLPAGNGWVQSVKRDLAVEIVVGLPSHAGRPPRQMHCQGRVRHFSTDRNNRLWVVMQFIQIQFEGPEGLSGSGFGNASDPGDRRGDRDSAIAEGRQSGAAPQPLNIKTQGE